jgi:hypothetical protein
MSKKGLKINNDRSLANTLSKPPSKKEFETTAKQANEQLNSYADRALKLANDLKKVMNDHTLAENKNILVIGIEKELITNLAQLAVDMNTDEYEREGMGSVGLLMMIFHHLMALRDRCNQLEYQLEQQKLLTRLDASSTK